jgi:hypothetical protein
MARVGTSYVSCFSNGQKLAGIGGGLLRVEASVILSKLPYGVSRRASIGQTRLDGDLAGSSVIGRTTLRRAI